MKDFDPETYAVGIRRENELEHKRIKQKIPKALAEARNLARRIVEETGTAEVILFGSLAESSVRNEQFDIDLAMKGGDWFKAQGIAENSSFKVDLIEYNEAPAHVRKRIDERGVRLWPEIP